MSGNISDETFVEAWMKYKGSVSKIAKHFNKPERHIYERRVNYEGKTGVLLPSSAHSGTGRPKEFVSRIGERINLTIKDGVVVVFGDAHYWPGDDSVAHKALIKFITDYQPMTIICNGDAFDGAKISRHPPHGWTKLPDVADELAFCKEKMGEIEVAAPPKAQLLWSVGNHDSRFSARLASVAPDYVRVMGTDLKDHFPAWNFSWSSHINDDVVCKHRFRNGIHATWNNTLHGGKTVVTNHLHRLAITPITDYNGRRYGVDCGTISDFGPETDKFDYGEDSPMNWASGFAVLTFKAGRLLPPELVTVQDSIAYFRGEPIMIGAKRRANAAPHLTKST